MPGVNFSSFTLEATPAVTDILVGYRSTATGGERRTTLDSLNTLFQAKITTGLTANALLKVGTAGALEASDLLYSGSTLTVPASFGITGAGSLAFTAGGSNQGVSALATGTGNFILSTVGGPTIQPYTYQGLQVVGAINQRTGLMLDAQGTNNPTFMGRRARDSAGSPSAVQSGDTLAQFVARGWGATGYPAQNPGIAIQANQAYTDSVAGTRITATVVLDGTTTGYESFRADAVGRIVSGAGGNKTISAWGVVGAISTFSNSSGGGVTITDSTSSGTVATAVANSFVAPTFAASSATTFTNAANLYIAGDVANGTNVTLTNSYGLWNVGKSRFDGAVTLPSTNTAGIQLYNTVDQVTNYERLAIKWSANVAIVRAEIAGSGSGRALVLGATGVASSTSDISLNRLTAPYFSWTAGSTGAADITQAVFTGTPTQTSGSNKFLGVTPTYNQASGTAANTDFLINRTETAVGSGAQYWEDRQVGSVSRMATGSAKVLTTDATVTTVQTFTIPASTTWAFDGYVVARRTGGASGTAEDGASYRVEGVIKNAAGTATSIGSTVTVIGESQAGWDVTVDVTGATARIRVTGASGNNVSWIWTGNVRQVSS